MRTSGLYGFQRPEEMPEPNDLPGAIDAAAGIGDQGSNSAMATTTSCVDSPQLSITPHQFEKANRIAHRMDLTHLIGVNGCNRDRLDLVACATGDD